MNNIQTNHNLVQVLNSIQHCLISNDAGDAVYQLTKFHQSYDDESHIDILTWGINQHYEVDTEGLIKTIAEYLPEDLREPFIQNLNKSEHLLITHAYNPNDSLAIHFNDATITLILNLTGQY